MQKKVKSFDRISIDYSINRVSKKFLIFLHGIGGDLTVWKKYAKSFNKKGFSTMAVDLRGHGMSDKPIKKIDYSIENSAKDIFQIIKKEKIKSFVFIGHCYGGMVAINFNKLFSRKAKGFVLIGTGYKFPLLNQIFIKKYLYKFFSELLRNKCFFKYKGHHGKYDSSFSEGDLISLKRLSSDLKDTGLEPLLYTYNSIFYYNEKISLKDLDKPVLIITGERDLFFNIKHAKKMKKLLTNSELIILKDANHWPIFNKEIEIRNLIYNFVTRIKW